MTFCRKRQDMKQCFIIFVFISDSEKQRIRDGCAAFFYARHPAYDGKPIRLPSTLVSCRATISLAYIVIDAVLVVIFQLNEDDRQTVH